MSVLKFYIQHNKVLHIIVTVIFILPVETTCNFMWDYNVVLARFCKYMQMTLIIVTPRPPTRAQVVVEI